ncbi:MAG TPA: hypothetical protein VH601_07705 [Bryobacteraceae bacterium]|jgi:hypothetical protein
MRASPVTRPFALCVAFTICLSGLCYSQKSAEITGKWSMVSITPDGDQIPWTLSINNDNGKYTATVEGNEGRSSARDIKVDGVTVHFRTTYQDEDYDVDLKLQENRLVGTWSGNGESGETQGTRATGS